MGREAERHRCRQFAVCLDWGFLSAGQTGRCPLQCHRLSLRFRADKPLISKSLPRKHLEDTPAIICYNTALDSLLQNSIDSIKAYKWTLSKKLPREYVKAEKKFILTSSQHVYALLLSSSLSFVFKPHYQPHSQSSISYLFLVTFSHFSLLNSSLHNWCDTKKEACYSSCWL